jgi:activator of HSP90 ATPase
MTGAAATGQANGEFTAWDGYIRGRTVKAYPGQKLVQAWRTAQFPEDAADSVLEIRFEASPGGTRVTFEHKGIPEGQGASYRQGWVDHYLVPMQAWFQEQNKTPGP